MSGPGRGGEAADDAVIRRLTPPRPGRFALRPGVSTMSAVVTAGVGGPEQLEYRDVPVPEVQDGEVLLRVLAAGVNPTDVNARISWYSPSVAEGTAAAAAGAVVVADGGWRGATPFPLIQGADCCGRVVAAASRRHADLVGCRVLVRPCLRPLGFDAPDTIWMGSDFDGAFAQFVTVPASEVFPLESDLTDAELGVLPCVAGTAENMLQRAGVRAGEHVLVTGATGGVGMAAVQLAVGRGARVTAVAAADRLPQVRALGAARCVAGAELAATLAGDLLDVVVDNVSGPGLDGLLRLLRPGGRYVSSGAIAGPQVSFDKRTFYLHDLTLLGCTAWAAPVFPAVIAAVESGALRLPVAATFPLAEIAAAQAALLARRRAGKLVLLPPSA